MKSFLIFLAALFCIAAWGGGNIQLAKGGKALYTIVMRPDARKLEKEAVQDLKWHLDKITGGDFKIGSAGSKRIFIGVPAPGDTEPMAKAERRLKVVNGDIYIYGESSDAAAFGVYDMLEKYCGCRWFTVWGESRIPADPDLALPEFNDSKIPPFFRFETTSLIGIGQSQRVKDFLRRHRVHASSNNGDDDGYLLGAAQHTFSRYLPPGHVPYGKRISSVMGPYEYFKDKKYFNEHPEWFTVNKSGQRVPDRQLCLSNREVRKEFLKNLEYVIQQEYKGGDAMVVVDINDRNAYICCCEGCVAMEKEYETKGGPFYDYLFELSKYFAKKYPRIIIRALAYGCTLTPPNRKLPSNVMMCYAPLSELDFLKDYNSSISRVPLEGLKTLAKSSDAHWKWMYISPYYRGVESIVHFAGIKRLITDMRIYHQYNVRAIFAEHGLFVNGLTNLQEMRVYTVFRMKEDLSMDEDKIVREYIDSCYGKAADMIYKHWQELEKLNLESSSIVKYNLIRPWYVDYITPANIIRWQKEFDTMEKLVADNPSALLHVKRDRLVIDQIVLGRWSDLAEINKRTYTRRKFHALRKEYLKDSREILEALYKDPAESPEKISGWISGTMSRLRKAIAPASPTKPTAPVAKRPLPKQFAAIPAANIQRCPVYPAVRPYYVRDPKGKIIEDPDAAFGTALAGKASTSMEFLARADYAKYLPNPVILNKLRKMPRNRYHYLHLGRTKFGPTGGWMPLGLTTPPGCVEFTGFGPGVCEVDFYISMKYTGNRKLFIDEVVLVKVSDK